MAPTLLHQQVGDATQSPAKVGIDQAQLNRFSHAIDQAALLYARQSQLLTAAHQAPDVT